MTELPLSQIAQLQPDGSIAFKLGQIPGVAQAGQAFLIFYLTQPDEQSGYGTVIQLDQQHQAIIYPDLNPEYTYLFFTDQTSHQFQTLLWCIEVATRNTEGLYIAQAKTHGRGVTPEDIQRFNQIMVNPAPTQPITESSPQIAQPELTPAAPTMSTTPAAPISTPPLTISTPPTIPVQPQAQPPAFQQPLAPAAPSAPTPAPLPPISLNEPLPQPTPPLPTPNSTPVDLPPLDLTEPSPFSPPIPELAAPTLSLPPLPPISQAQPSAIPNPPQPTNLPEPELSLPPLSQLANQSGFTQSSIQPQSPAPASRNPVGRPPKPLMPEPTWMIDQPDFNWLKTVSHEELTSYQTELRQKVNQQLQRHRPDLLQDAGFMTSFDATFAAICQTYSLIPTIRQDLLKALLNGRVIEALAKQISTGR